MFIVTQGYGPATGFTGTLTGTIPDYSSTGDTYVVTANALASPTIAIVFDQEITGLDKSGEQQ